MTNKGKFSFQRYASKRRWQSYWHQVDEVLKTDPRKVLIIGVGDGIVPAVLKQIFCNEFPGEGREVYTFDYDKDLNPDYLGDLRDIKKVVGDLKVDCILCCEVLEHLEYKYADSILYELSLIANNVIISIPYRHVKHFEIIAKLPKIKRFTLSLMIPMFYRTWKFDGVHYWELGTKGYSKKSFCQLLEKNYILVRRFHVPENHYHLFHILKPKRTRK